MARPEASTPLALDMERLLDAPPERVFRAWTEPEEMEAWFAPDPAMRVEASVDLRVGGRYRLRMGEYVVSGAYTEIRPPHRLAFTWAWVNDEGAGADAETKVIIDLEPAPEGTRLRLHHEALPNETQRDEHAQGWNACLPRLEEHLGRPT